MTLLGESWEGDEPTALPTHCPFLSSYTNGELSLGSSSAHVLSCSKV